jgi:hypothetical protein
MFFHNTSFPVCPLKNYNIRNENIKKYQKTKKRGENEIREVGEMDKLSKCLKVKDKIENDKTSKGVCVFVVDPQGNNIGYIMVNEKLEVMDRLEKGYKVNGE